MKKYKKDRIERLEKVLKFYWIHYAVLLFRVFILAIIYLFCVPIVILEKICDTIWGKLNINSDELEIISKPIEHRKNIRNAINNLKNPN